YVRIDRKKKFPATELLRACGIESDAELLQIFYPYEDAKVGPDAAEPLLGRICCEDVADKASGEILREARHPVTHEAIKRFLDKKVESVKVLVGNPIKEDPTILETLRNDTLKTTKEAQQDIYKKLRGQEFIVP